MANRFKDIILEDLGLPTTAITNNLKKEWNELEEAIYKVDQCFDYSRNLYEELVEAFNKITFPSSAFYPNTVSGLHENIQSYPCSGISGIESCTYSGIIDPGAINDILL